MNDIDIRNIKKELAKRKAANYTWENGGDMCKDDVILRTTMDLNGLVGSYEGDKHIAYINQIKQKVDDIFKKYGKENENMILLQCLKRCDYDLYTETDYDDIVKCVSWDLNEYNTLCFPIFKDLTEKEKVPEDFNIHEINELCNLLDDAKIKWDTEEIIDNDMVNEYWNGYTAITKDYKIVVFSIRYDGMLSNNKFEYEKFIY